MGTEKKSKKKCCGKFVKKGKHCSSCPITTKRKSCKADKNYCDDCQIKSKKKKEQKGKKDKKVAAMKKKKKI